MIEREIEGEGGRERVCMHGSGRENEIVRDSVCVCVCVSEIVWVICVY